MGFLETLGLVFVVLKLIGVIGWSWFWATLPISFGFVFITIPYISLKIYIARLRKAMIEARKEALNG